MLSLLITAAVEDLKARVTKKKGRGFRGTNM